MELSQFINNTFILELSQFINNALSNANQINEKVALKSVSKIQMALKIG